MLGGAEFLLSTVSPYQNAKKKSNFRNWNIFAKKCRCFFSMRRKMGLLGKKDGSFGGPFFVSPGIPQAC